MKVTVFSQISIDGKLTLGQGQRAQGRRGRQQPGQQAAAQRSHRPYTPLSM